jgi:hypothetical protein
MEEAYEHFHKEMSYEIHGHKMKLKVNNNYVSSFLHCVVKMVYFNCQIIPFFQEYMYFETSKRSGIISTLTCRSC